MSRFIRKKRQFFFVLICFIMLALCLVSCKTVSHTKNSAEIAQNQSNITISPSEPPDTDRKDSLEAPQSANNGVLAVYFSVTGNTEQQARFIAEITDADLYRITPQDPYTEEDIRYYTDCRADREQNDPNARPAITGDLPDTSQYNVVFIGYPIWHGQAPRIISTFLESVDMTGVTVIPFCTSHSSGIGSSDTNLHSLAPNANWIAGRRFAATTTKDELKKWIDGLDIKNRSDGKEKRTMNITVSGKTFYAILADTEAANSFAGILPQTFEMSELNGNEKYVYLDERLPSKAETPGRIEPGDIMLYGNNCVVVFYEGLNSSYPYTRLGKINDTTGLKEALGKGDVTATFGIEP